MGHLRPEATHLSRDAWITGWQRRHLPPPAGRRDGLCPVPPRSDAPTAARWPTRTPCAPASESGPRSHDRRADADRYTCPKPWQPCRHPVRHRRTPARPGDRDPHPGSRPHITARRVGRSERHCSPRRAVTTEHDLHHRGTAADRRAPVPESPHSVDPQA